MNTQLEKQMCRVGKGKRKLINQPHQQLKVVDSPSDLKSAC